MDCLGSFLAFTCFLCLLIYVLRSYDLVQQPLSDTNRLQTVYEIGDEGQQVNMIFTTSHLQ